MSTDAKISFYNSARDVAPSKGITIRELVRIIHDEEHVDAVALVRSAQTEDEKKAAKMKLPAVQISGHVTEGNRAQAIQQGRFTHSGWLQLDIDGDGLNGNTPQQARAILGADRHVLSAFITPSGKGAKALFKVRPCSTDEEHKGTFRAVEKYIGDTFGMKLDPSTKDTGRLCYLSADKDCTWNGAPMEFVSPVEMGTNGSQSPPTPKPSKSSKAFPVCPEHGIHGWLMEGAWFCRLQEGMSEADTVTKLEGFSGTLRRPYEENEVRDAVAKVFASPLPASIFDISEQAGGRVDLSKFTQTDAGNAERVHAYAGSNFRYVTESGQWLLWDGKRWTPDNNGGMVRLFVSVMRLTGKSAFECGDPDLAKAISKHALKSMDSNKVSAGLQMLKSILGVSVSVNDLDADPWMIGTADGMIDLQTGRPITPDRAKLITKMIGTVHDPDATCPTWEKFLGTVTAGDTELIGFLQSAIGYTLTGSNREQCLFFLHGSGCNGKGVFSETIKRLIGDYGQTAPESLFTKDRNQSATNDVARLAGCRMAIAAELEEGACFAESRIKSLTGGDTITARFLHQEFFDFRPSHHFWISGNHKPTVKGSDLGIWRRIRLIPFTVRISDAEKDPNLADKLAEELPGILNWALEGCMRWQRDGLKTPRCVADATEEYRIEEDVIGQFLAERTEDDPQSRVLISSLYEAYQTWAITGGMKYPLTAQKLNKKFDERGMNRIKSGDGRFWAGIAIV
jgi:P4 family phage/plasmid primase-like protien